MVVLMFSVVDKCIYGVVDMTVPLGSVKCIVWWTNYLMVLLGSV